MPDDPTEIERAWNTTTLEQLAREAGLDPDKPFPVSVAKLLPAFGRATSLRAQEIMDEPDALRWTAVTYRFWAAKLMEFAAAAEAANQEAITAAAEQILRGDRD